MAALPRRLLALPPTLAGIATVGLAIALVETFVRMAVINPYIVPLPSEVFLAMGRIVVEEDVLHRFLVTGGGALTAAILVTVIGIPAGTMLFRLRALRHATEVWIASMAAAPIGLMYPLFLVILGRNMWTLVAIGTLTGLPPVILKTLEGLSAVPPVLTDVGRSFRLAPYQLFTKIMLPAALPGIFAGVRIGLIFSTISVVGMEFLINIGGLGPLISELAERYDLPGTYAAIGFVVLVCVFFFLVIEKAEQWLQPQS